MKLVKICAVGAFLCGPSFCHAQIQILDHVGIPKSRLVSTDETRLQPAPAAEVSRDPELDEAEFKVQEVDDPFSYTHLSPSDQAESQKNPATASDPKSLPVGIHHRRNAIDQILQQGIVSQVPHTSYAPVDWPMQQSYNPTAQVLLYSRCANGLWDNYAAEQAAYCAHIQAHLTHSHRGHCATCSAAACTPGCGGGSCTTGNAAASMRFNRYTNSCANCDTPAAPIAQPIPTNQATQPYFQPSVEPGQIPVPTPASQPTTGFVPGLIERPAVERPASASVIDPATNLARLPTITR